MLDVIDTLNLAESLKQLMKNTYLFKFNGCIEYCGKIVFENQDLCGYTFNHHSCCDSSIYSFSSYFSAWSLGLYTWLPNWYLHLINIHSHASGYHQKPNHFHSFPTMIMVASTWQLLRSKILKVNSSSILHPIFPLQTLSILS